MNKIRPIIFAVLLLLATTAKAVHAGPMLKLSPSNESHENGSTFDVLLGVDSGTNKSIAVDAWVTFDPAKLEVVSINAVSSPAFANTMAPQIHNADGAFDISFNASGDSVLSEAVPIKGDLVTIKFKAKSTGTADVRFTCTAGSTIDTNIFDTTGNDVIDCASNVNGSYNITSGSGGNNNTNPTSTPVINNVTTAPGELPRTGGFETTLGLMIFGLVGAMAGVALKWL